MHSSSSPTNASPQIDSQQNTQENFFDEGSNRQAPLSSDAHHIHQLSREQLLDQIEILQTNLHKSAHYGSSLLTQIKSLQKKQSTLHEHFQHENDDAQENTVRIRLLEDQVDQFREKIKEVTISKVDTESQNDKLNEELHLLRIENDTNLEKLERFREMCRTFERERDTLRSEKQRLERHDLKKLREQNDALRRKCDEFEQSLKERFDQKLEARRTQSLTENGTIVQLRQQLNSIQKKLLQEKQEKVHIRSDNDSLRHQLEESVHILRTTKQEFKRYVESVSGVVSLTEEKRTLPSPTEHQSSSNHINGDPFSHLKVKGRPSSAQQASSLQMLEFEAIFVPTFLNDIKRVIQTVQEAHISFPTQLQIVSQEEHDSTKALEKLEAFIIETNQTLSKIEQETLEGMRSQLRTLVQYGDSNPIDALTGFSAMDLVSCFIDVAQRLVNRTAEINSTMLQKTHQNMKIIHYRDLCEELQEKLEEITAKNLKLLETQKDMSQHSHTIDTLRQNIASLEVNFQKQFTSNEEEILSLQRENVHLRETKSQKIKTLKLKVQDLREQVSTMETTHTTSSQNEADIKLKVDTIQEENQSRAQRIKELEEKAQIQEQRIEILQKELHDRDSLIDKHVAQNEKNDQRIMALSLEKNHLFIEKSDASLGIQHGNRCLSLVERIVTNKCKVLNYSLLRSLSHLRFEVQTLRTELNRSEQLVACLKREIHASKERICEQALQNAVLCSSLNDLEEAYHNLQRNRFLL